jgi:hypothetical protein
MISPNTPPGTKVVVLPRPIVTPPGYRNVRRGILEEGREYIVREIVHFPIWGRGVFGVRLREVELPNAVGPLGESVEGSFGIFRFRLAVLPKSITDILTAVPVMKTEKVG